MDKTPQQIADEFTESAASLGGAPFVPAQLRDAVAAAASFAQATAGELNRVRVMAEQVSLVRELHLRIVKQDQVIEELQKGHAEQVLQIHALQTSQLGAHAELEARVSALEQQGKA